MIIGISDTHNAAAALIDKKGTLYALQEERCTGIKNFSGFPEGALNWLLDISEQHAKDIEIVALASKIQPPDRDRTEIIEEYRSIGSTKSLIKKWLRNTPIYTYNKKNMNKKRISRLVNMGFKEDRIRFYEHHSCHAATAYYGWGKWNESVLVLTCDGAGDGLCATVNIGKNGEIERLYTVNWGDSIAIVYAVITYMMGMVPLEHEYKIMGMAPYAKGSSADKVADKLLQMYEWDSTGKPVWKRKKNVPHAYYIKPLLEKLFFEERFDSIMAGAQLFIERMLVEFVRRAVNKTGIHKVALSGGVFMNVKANKEILALPEVEDLFIYPSCGDETNSIGACYIAQKESRGLDCLEPLNNFYLGPEWSENEIMTVVENINKDGDLNVTVHPDINMKVAELLSQGEVVARFTGREEFGARSLGNRAILADPRNPEVIKVINEMIKNRDFWMPFAASILDESEKRYLYNEKSVKSPYMILSFDSTSEGRADVKAGTHPYDGTCRPQIVTKEDNKDYWDLIKKFEKLTNVGSLLNTSLNLHGLPLAHSPDDAIHVLNSSGLKYLAMGNVLLSKK